VLVAFNDKPEALVYSLPYLEHLHTFALAKICEKYVLFNCVLVAF